MMINKLSLSLVSYLIMLLSFIFYYAAIFSYLSAFYKRSFPLSTLSFISFIILSLLFNWLISYWIYLSLLFKWLISYWFYLSLLFILLISYWFYLFLWLKWRVSYWFYLYSLLIVVLILISYLVVLSSYCLTVDVKANFVLV